MPKQGFKGQWIEICKKGKFVDSGGAERDISGDFLNQVVSNYSGNEAPAVIGHPEDNAPAFGWVSSLRVNNDVLEAQFSDTDDQFEKDVEAGRYRKRSVSLYFQPAPSLRHVGFFGAHPVAVKGMREIHFNDGDKKFCIISFNEETKMDEKELDQVTESVWKKMKAALGFDKGTNLSETQGKTTGQFSAADLTRIMEEAKEVVKEEITAEFAEQMKTRDEELKGLKDQISTQGSTATRSAIASFVEQIPAEKARHYLKNIGVVDFLEACAIADANDKTPAVFCFSEGEGDKKVDHRLSRLDWAKSFLSALPNFIEFGERFGDFKATAEVDNPVDHGQLSEMRSAMGIKTEKAGGEKINANHSS